MAQTKTITCDRCGVLVTKAAVLLVVQSGALPRRHFGRGIDLCGPCGRLFDAWLGAGPEFTTADGVAAPLRSEDDSPTQEVFTADGSDAR